MKNPLIFLFIWITLIYCQSNDEYLTVKFKLNTDNYYCKLQSKPPQFNPNRLVTYLLKPSSYTFIFEKHGYQTYYEKINVIDNITKNITLRENINIQLPTPLFGKLKINVVPSNARLFLNNKQIEHISSTDLVVGKYELIALHDYYEIGSRQFDIFYGDTSTISLNLNPITSSLKINTIPDDSIRIYFNENYAGITPYLHEEILIGKYNITLRDENYLPENFEIDVLQNEPKIISVKLTNYQLYQKNQRDYWQYNKRFWGILTVYFASAGYVLNQKAEDTYSNYYMKSEEEQEIKKFRNDVQLLDIFTHIASAAAISSASSFIRSFFREKSYPK